MGDQDRTFEIIERVAEKPNPVPRTTKAVDGFTRQDVVNAFQRAFTMIGGVQRLALWANQNPDKFFPLYAKMMPSTSIQFGNNTVQQIFHALPPTALDNHPIPAQIIPHPAVSEQEKVE